jgi:PAS domain S-box-containing protein/hemerythrin-like metal-binding protein
MRRIGGFLVLLAIVQLLAWLTPPQFDAGGIQGYLPLHALLETGSIVVSMMIFAVGWHTHGRKLPGNIMVLACVFFTIGLLDFSHTVTYQGMPEFVTPNNADKQLNFWLAARLLAAAVLLAAAIWPWRPLKSAKTRYLMLGALLSLALLINWAVLFHQDALPRTFIPGQGLTPLKKNLEYFSIALNVITALLLWIRMRQPQPFNVPLLFAAVCVMAMGEFFFTLYTTMTGGYNVLGHVYKVISYLFIYRAIVVETIEHPYNRLRDQEGIYRAVADNGQALIWMAGLDKGCYYFNQPWLAFTGSTLEQEFGNGWTEGVHPDDLQRCLDTYVKAFDQREAFSRIYRLRRHDGDYRWLLDDGAPRYDSDGLFVGYVGHCLDVTEHKQAEDALRESEALFRAVSESAHDAIVTADSAGKIVKWNPSATTMFGYSESEAIGQSLTLLMPARFRDQHDAGMSRVSAGGEPHVMGNPVELAGLRKDGSEFPLELSLGRWQIADNQFFTGVIRDITERKKIERKLENQKEHLEELVEKRTIELTRALDVAKVADQSKDAFLANMSHELRTPLSAVIGMANLAQGISTEPKLHDYLEKIVRSGKHLNRIINELLDLSKIAAGHMELETISFSLRTMIAHVESLMSHRAAEKGLKLVVAIDDAVPDVLLGDPTRVTQIFLNLIGNAIKFTQAGQIAVRTSLQAHEGGRVCLGIAFEDTGIGMRPEELKQLFKPFSQVDATVSRKYGGTGLGLTISRRLAEMMGGDISVTSVEGSGTTFKLTIWLGLGNAADLSASEPAADEALPMRYQDARILVADDQPLNREIVEALLAAVGITPRLAGNGQEVLDILTESGPDAFDLVLMDIQMPVMDGLTATRVLRGLAGFEKLPIIAMTAHTLAHEQELNAAAGMNDHIGKPFDNPSFYRTLAKWIPQSKQKTGSFPPPPPGLPLEGGGDDVSCGHANTLADPGGLLAETGNELSSLRDVDVAAALARFCGNEVSYRRWLADFVATAGAVPGQIRSEIAARQADQAGKLAHAFKGKVVMLGMTGLHGMVLALEPVLRDGTPADALLATLERSIGEMCSELARVLQPAKPDKPDKPESAPATQVLESVVWDDAYSVGVAAMDAQHKKLVGMINRLAECHAARSSGRSDAFHEVLSQMCDYTQVHFESEEDYLQRIGYPQLADHKVEHDAFVGKMTAFSMAATDGVQDEAAVHRYLKGWLLSHILESDMQYRAFVQSRK